MRTMKIKTETAERLKREGLKGETYDQVINNLLDEKRKRGVGPMRPCAAPPSTRNAGETKGEEVENNEC